MNGEIELIQGFAWAVPVNFGDALAGASFKPGDILYDCKEGYLPWGDAIKELKHSIQIKSASSQSPDSAGDSFAKNWMAPVDLVQFDHQSKRSISISTTQGHVYTLLWKGVSGRSQWHSERVEPPLRVDAADAALESISGKCVEKTDSQHPTVFLMAHDTTASSQLEKLRQARKGLRHFSFRELWLVPEDVGAEKSEQYAPSIRFVGFAVQCDRESVCEALKSVFYKPTKDKVTDRVAFRLRAHGLLISVPFNRIKASN
jgi:hypothetical protein